MQTKAAIYIYFKIFIYDLGERMECTLNKFTDNTKLGGRHYREICTDWINGLRPLMRFSKTMCRILHLGHKNPMQSYRVGKEWLEICLEEKNLLVLVNSCWTYAEVCQSGQMVSRPVSQIVWFAAQGQWSFCCIGTGGAAPWILFSGFMSFTMRRVALISSAHSCNEGFAPFVFKQTSV